MKKIILFSSLFIASLFFIASDRNPHQGDNKIIQPYPFAVDSKLLDANNISTWFRTNGSFNYTPTAQIAGFEWPKGTGLHARFASGLWLGAVVNNDTLTTVAEYSFEYLPGYTDNSGNPQGKDDPNYRIYKLYRGGGSNDVDRAVWPNALLGHSDQGAPVYFDTVSQSWKPLDIGDQTMFYLYTDSYPESHNTNNTAPLKADVKQTNFSFSVNGPLNDIAFTQFVIINRSNHPWNNAYLTAWTDDDLGQATDDLVGCDTTLSLGYTYNGDNFDGDYGANPPAVAFDFFRGALLFTGNDADTAFVCDGNRKIGKPRYRLRGMDVFNWYFNGGDPRNATESYRFMSGRLRDGGPIITPTGDTTHYYYSGNPVTNQGWVQTGPNDQRFLQSTGPFTMNPGDTQIVVLGQVIARGTSNLNSITVLKQNDGLAQRIYNNCFNVPPSPPKPNVNYFAPGNGKIYLSWDDLAERTVTPDPLSGGTYRFQGYNVYQIKAGTNGSNAADRKLIRTFDLNDNIGDIRDSIYDPNYGIYVYVVVQPGTNGGISRYIVIERDEIQSLSLINGTPYYFSVTAYAYDSLGGPFTSPKVLESSLSGNMITVIPQHLVQGTQVHYDVGDTISTNRRDISVMPIVVRPLSLIDASYKSTFGSVSGLSWTLTRTIGSNTQVLIQNSTDFTGLQDTVRLIDGFFPIHQIVLDSGVVKDPQDPLSLTQNIHTRLMGWSYSPASNQWVQGPDTSRLKTIPPTALFRGAQFESRSMGISFPTINTFRSAQTQVVANGSYFVSPKNGTDNLSGGPLRKVRIVFGQTQKAYRYVPDPVLGADTNFQNSPYVDYVNVPFSVYAIDELDSSQGNPRQLNCAFIDADNNGIWDPDTTKMGKFQILYIFASSYSSSTMSSYTDRNPGFNSQFGEFDIMYVWVPRVIKGGPQSYTSGDVLDIYPYTITRPDFVPGYPIYYSWNVQGTIITSSSLASQNNQMNNVKAFPNPYYGQSRLESDPINRFIYFSNLPKECTIYIYTLNGVLIRKIYRNVSDPRNSLEKWDLRNDSDIPIASGMYIVLIDAPGIGTKTLKLAIFTPEERIDTF